MARRSAVAAAVLMAELLLLLAGCGGGDPGEEVTVDSSALRGTVILPTLDAPVPAGKSAVWCGTFGLAWKRLSADVVKGSVRIPGAEDLCERLDRDPLGEGDLPSGSWYAAAGRVGEGIRERIRTEMATAFPAAPAPDLGGAESAAAAAVAYAYLEAAVRFDVPFRQNEKPLEFTDSSGRTTRVRSFGSGFPVANRSGERAWEQVEILYLGPGFPPSEFVVDPCRSSDPVQVVLARIPSQGSLAGTVAIAEEKVSRFRGDRDLGSQDKLLIPDIRFDVRHRFQELIDGRQIMEALQSIRFRLDRRGVELKAEAIIAAPAASMCHLIFDRPFLVYLKKRRGRPFFAAWIDDPELLVKW